MKGLRIVAAGGITLNAEEEACALAPHFARIGRKAPRRSSRFDQLALLGALLTMPDHSENLPDDSPLYLATGQGNVADTAQILEGLYRRHEAPMPFGFINVSSNLAGFHVASALGLHGPNLTLSRRRFAFGATLELALADASGGRLRQGLIGGVDACCWPLEAHRQRLGLDMGAPLGEGSHWLIVDQEATQPLAVIEEVRNFPNCEAALSHVRTLPAGTRLVTTSTADASVSAFVHDAARPVWHPADEPGYYDTICAQTLGLALRELRGTGVCVEAGGNGDWNLIVFNTGH